MHVLHQAALGIERIEEAGHGLDELVAKAQRVVLGTARSFGMPATQALLPTLVPGPQFSSAIAWNASLWQSASVMGPALGGFLYALGPGVVFGLAGGSFALASVLTLLIRFRPAAVSERPPITWAALSAGIDYIRSQPVVLGAISLDLFTVLLGGATALASAVRAAAATCGWPQATRWPG